MGLVSEVALFPPALGILGRDSSPGTAEMGFVVRAPRQQLGIAFSRVTAHKNTNITIMDIFHSIHLKESRLDGFSLRS